MTAPEDSKEESTRDADAVTRDHSTRLTKVVVEDLPPAEAGRDRSGAVGARSSTAGGMRSQARRGPSVRARRATPVDGHRCHAGFRSKYPPSGHASPLPITDAAMEIFA